MADQAITALPKKTYSGSSQIASTDYLLGIDSAEGYQMLIQDLGEYIINRVTASLAGSTQTLASAISALNSKLFEKRSSQRGSVLKIVFNNYSTGALIFGATSNTNPFVYVYSNGYLAPVVMDNNINVELSSDYKTVTITNNTDTALYIDVINPKGDASIINA